MKRPGEILRKRREELGLNLQELESSSNISRRLLEALESDQYDTFAAESYYRGFLKNYAESLKLDPQLLLNAYQNVKIIESPLPMNELTGNTGKKKLSPLLFGIVILLLLVTGAIVYLAISSKADSNGQGQAEASQEQAPQKEAGKAPTGTITVNRYPWMQDLQDGLILHFVLDPKFGDMLQPEMQVKQSSQGFLLVSLNLEQDYELTLASGKTDSLPLRLSRHADQTDAKLSYRLDFTLQSNDEIPAVLINLSSSSTANDQSQTLPDFPQKDLSDKFRAFQRQNQQSVPHAIIQASKPVPLQLQLTFQRDSYIRYQWFGQDAQEFPVLKNKQLLLQGEAPLILWLSDVNATNIKINGQDLVPEAFQNVFIGRLEWKREASVARLYLTPGS